MTRTPAQRLSQDLGGSRGLPRDGVQEMDASPRLPWPAAALLVAGLSLSLWNLIAFGAMALMR